MYWQVGWIFGLKCKKYIDELLCIFLFFLSCIQKPTTAQKKGNLLTNFFKKFASSFFPLNRFRKKFHNLLFSRYQICGFLQIPELQPVLDEFGNTIPDKGGRTELQIIQSPNF
jgi:hypothetical protein